MPDDEVSVVWIKGPTDVVRGFHEACAKWLEIAPNVDEERKPHHTEICRGCGRFLLMPPPEHGKKPDVDVTELLK